MDRFSSTTFKYLKEGGWQPGRKTWLAKYRAYLSGEGYAWFPAVADFLSEFGDLLIKFKREDGSPDAIDLDACRASAGVWFPDYYAPRIGQTRFCVIGQSYSNHLLLFMDEAGRVYGGFDEFLCLIGNSGTEAIENICSNKPSHEIPE